MSGPEAWLAEARKWIGTKESPPFSNRTPFGAELGLSASAWCGTFQLYCARHSGNESALRGLSTFSTQAFLRRAKALGMEVSAAEARPGDLLVMTHTPTTGHIGILESRILNSFASIEGNIAYGNDRDGGEVMRRVRNASAWNGGIIRPAYAVQASAPAPVIPPATEWVPAIDVAKYQGQIDHAAVKAAGIELAIVKLHNTKEVDPSALGNVSGFAAAGVPAAGYWYAHTYLDRDPAVQARNDAAWARQLSPFSPFYMADIESGENEPLTPTAIGWWNAYIAALPPQTWLYGGANYLGMLDQAIIARHPVISARYPRQGAAPAAAQWDEFALALPAPTWPVSFQWSGWQFTSSGAVPGVPAKCDLNIIRRSALSPALYPPGVSMNPSRSGKLVQEAGLPAVYLGHDEGIVYRWVTDTDDLTWCQFAIQANGGDPTIHQVDKGKLKLMGVLVGPPPQ